MADKLDDLSGFCFSSGVKGDDGQAVAGGTSKAMRSTGIDGNESHHGRERRTEEKMRQEQRQTVENVRQEERSVGTLGHQMGTDPSMAAIVKTGTNEGYIEGVYTQDRLGIIYWEELDIGDGYHGRFCGFYFWLRRIHGRWRHARKHWELIGSDLIANWTLGEAPKKPVIDKGGEDGEDGDGDSGYQEILCGVDAWLSQTHGRWRGETGHMAPMGLEILVTWKL